jgi:hypothetical protein
MPLAPGCGFVEAVKGRIFGSNPLGRQHCTDLRVSSLGGPDQASSCRSSPFCSPKSSLMLPHIEKLKRLPRVHSLSEFFLLVLQPRSVPVNAAAATKDNAGLAAVTKRSAHFLAVVGEQPMLSAGGRSLRPLSTTPLGRQETSLWSRVIVRVGHEDFLVIEGV